MLVSWLGQARGWFWKGEEVKGLSEVVAGRLLCWCCLLFSSFLQYLQGSEKLVLGKTVRNCYKCFQNKLH